MRSLSLFTRCLIPGTLVLLTLGAFAQSTPPLAADTGTLERVIKDLASDNFATRDDAQKRLDRISYKQRDELAHLLASTMDAEVQARLAARLQDIDESLAVNPPPITLHLKDATLVDVAAALTQQTGIFFEISVSDKALRFTLEATDIPFWEAIAALCRQHPLAYESGSRGPRLRDGGSNALRTLQIHDGFAIALTSISRRSSVDPQRQPPNQVIPPATKLEVMLLADPRIQVDTMTQRPFYQLTDDLGNNLIDTKQLLSDEKVKTTADVAWRKSFTLSFPPPLLPAPAEPPKPAAKITTVKGSLTFGVRLSGQKTAFEDAEKHVGEALSLGVETLTLTRFTVTDKQLSLSTTTQRPAGVKAGAPDTPQLRLLDANGILLWKATLSSSNSATVARPFAEPLRLELSAPEKNRDVKIPYEFKDIPLP